MISPIKYFGGKSSMRSIIMNLMPEHEIYVEAFGVGGTILFAKDPSIVEIYNDLEQDIFSIFKVLSNKKLFKKFKELLDLTYYSRDIRSECIKRLKIKNLSYVNRAYCYYMVIRTSYNGHGGFSTNLSRRRGMNKATADYLSSIERLPLIHDRLSTVIIENRDAIEIITKYDAENVFMYLDPPYVLSSRLSATRYKKEMTDSQHEKLIETILHCKSKVLLSGYDNKIYDKLLLDCNWRRIDFKSPNAFSESTESFWLNYDGGAAQLTLF